MSGARHRRVSELFLAACELEGEAREALLAHECAGDDELRREVEELVGVDAAGVVALDRAAWPAESAVPHGPQLSATLDVERLAARAAGRAYELQEELGRGGMGRVVRAHDVDLRRDLALKISLAALEGGGPGGHAGHDAARFLAEARTTARLDHPGIVPVHDLGIDAEGRLFFTMKLVHGRELGTVLALAHVGREGWNMTRVVGVLRQVCDAVAYAHAKGIVHRDLKSSNVMVGDFGEVYVMDWGISRVLGAGPEQGADGAAEAAHEAAASDGGAAGLTRAGAILGTPHAMSPEQARGEPVGPAADVYAVGVMLYEALVGRRPYERAGHQDPAYVVLARIAEGPPAPLRVLAPRAPAELVAIAERAMARDPRERYADMRAMAEDLRAYLEGRVVRAHRTGALAELRKWIARNRLAAGGLAVALAAIVGGLAWSRQVEARSRREIDLASDYFRARVVRDSADDLWPATPETVPRMADWIARAEQLVARRGVHADRLARLAADAGVEPAELGRVRALCAHLDELEHVETRAGLLADVRARLVFATSVEERSLTSPDAAERWRAARAAILAGETCADYAGLDLAPQLGLLPIGADPRTGLWEFAHLETGEAATRDAAGRLTIGPETGLVFVLLPGGTFEMGGADQEGEPNHDRAATGGERPVRAVTLVPFFLSKYELTQAQWRRLTGANPSRWAVGHRGVVTATNPVEQVSWHDVTRVLGRIGLVLPSEARWEYACRAGTTTPFSCEPNELARFANVADKSYGAVFTRRPDDEPFDDGHAFHAPVGSFAANPFGLHEMHGNVLEWTLDPYGSYVHARDPRDGRTLGPDAGGGAAWWSPDIRVARGGNYELNSVVARSSRRISMHPTFVNHALGVRPAREVEAPHAR